MSEADQSRGRAEQLPRPVMQLARLLRAVTIRFLDDECLVRASALAYITLLSLVPLLALMFAVLKGLGAQRRLEPLLLSRFALNPETADQIIGFIDRTNVGTLGALGAATLFLTVVSVLGAVESSLNHIWRVPRGRSYWRKLTDYSSVVLLTPLLLLAAVAITSSLQERELLHSVLQNTYLGTLAVQALRVLPIVINAIALAILYAVMTNRRPHVRGILIGAVVAGALWHAVQWAYVAFQIGMARYNAIYGALSQLPITLVWLYFSAVVVLAGAELAAVVEFGSDVAPGAEAPPRWLVAAHVLLRAAERFRTSGGAVDPITIARELRVDSDVVGEVAQQLQQAALLAVPAAQPSAYMLARDPQAITLAQVDALADAAPLPASFDARLRAIADHLAAQRRAAQASLTLSDVLAATSGDRPGQRIQAESSATQTRSTRSVANT